MCSHMHNETGAVASTHLDSLHWLLISPSLALAGYLRGDLGGASLTGEGA